jgi:hypothetical protein
MASSSTINTFITHVSFYYPRKMNKKWVNTPGSDSTASVPPSSRSCWLARNSQRRDSPFGGEAFIKDSINIRRDTRPVIADFAA